MMIRHFQRHHRAFSPGYSLPKGPDDPREPRVLLGDAPLFTAISGRWNPYAQGHAAGVLSLVEKIPDKAATELAAEFMDILLPGMRPDHGQFLAIAIGHNERAKRGGTRSGIHWFAGMTDLWANRKLNVLWPARDAVRLEAWQELVNIREDWGSPKELERKRGLRLRWWPDCPEGAERAQWYAQKLSRLPLEQVDCRDEVACALALNGAHDIQLDQTAAGRCRVRFGAVSQSGKEMGFSVIAPDKQSLDPLRHSALRRLLGDNGYQRTPRVFQMLKTELIRQVEHASRRLQSSHQVCPDKLAGILHSLEMAKMAPPQLVEVEDETQMGFPSFNLPTFMLEPFKPVLAGPELAVA